MSKAPPIPPDQRSSPREQAHIQGVHGGRHEQKAGIEAREHDNLREQGRQGNMNQNLRHRGRQHEG